jgi:hypothetical protein
LDSLISAADELHPDWKLLNSVSNYMSENIYHSLPNEKASVLYQRAFAALLIKGKFSLEELFGMDPANALDGDELKTAVAKTSAGRQVFVDSIRESWHVWPIDTYVNEERVPSEVETEITGRARRHLKRHIGAKVTCIKLRQPNRLALAISHRDLTNKPDATKSAAKTAAEGTSDLLQEDDPNGTTWNSG